MHTYCRICKKNLYYGTTIHDCDIGFGPGQLRPDMIPEYLANTPWWQEPTSVQIENVTNYCIRLLSVLYLNWQTEELVADLD